MKHQDILMQRNNAIAKLIGKNQRDDEELNKLRLFYKSWCEFHAECGDPEATEADKQQAASILTVHAQGISDLYGRH